MLVKEIMLQKDILQLLQTMVSEGCSFTYDAENDCIAVSSKSEKFLQGVHKFVSTSNAEAEEQDEMNTEKWIEWNGGKCPVQPSKSVEVKFRNGEICSDKTSSWRWSHIDSAYDIVAYRLIK